MDAFLQVTLVEQNICCKFQAIDHLSIVVQIVILGCASLLGLIALRNIWILNKLIEFKKSFQKNVYLLIAGWVISTMSKCIFNIIAYDNYMIYPKLTDSEYSVEENLSASFYCCDILSTFFVVWLIFLIPYRWIKTTLNALSTLQMDIPDRKKVDRIFKILKIVKVYTRVRIFVLPCLLLAIYLIIVTSRENQEKCNYSGISIIFATLQSILCIAFYILSQLHIVPLKKFIPLSHSDYRQLKIQYLLLQLACFSRTFLNISFYITGVIFDKMAQISPHFTNCLLNDNEENISFANINVSFLAIAEFLMHILPISIILYIYKPTPDIKSFLSEESTDGELIYT